LAAALIARSAFLGAVGYK